MVIVNKSLSKIAFVDLACGDVFKDKYGNICLKTETTDCGVNTVRLSDGSYDYTSSEEDVDIVKCQLVIE